MTVAGHTHDDLAPGTLNSILKQAQLKGGRLMRYGIVIEKAEKNYSAYVPDLPGCVATGQTADEAEREIREAIRFHVDGLREDGQPILSPTAICDYVEA